jgi:Bifunctional DNA primase/polymerase, N-terminal/Primase C terminal 2 (PriCT-2)
MTENKNRGEVGTSTAAVKTENNCILYSAAEPDKQANERRMVDHALAYAARGWFVFPAPANGEKKSHKSAEFSSGRAWGATTNAQQIQRDFTRWPNANIGVVTGPKSGIFVVEADTPEGHNVDGIASMRALEARHGALPETLAAESPSGSLHYYLNYPPDVTITNTTSKIGPGIDVLGDGGMVIAPPSNRPGKGQYKWLNAAPIADAPPWLIELATAGDDDAPHEPNSEPEADPALLAAAMAALPNSDVPQREYNKVGMACWAAFGGSAEGFEAFDQWARKSKKYHGGTRKRWAHYFKSPPSKLTAGSIIHWANQASPGWREAYEAVAMDDTTRAALAGVEAFCARLLRPKTEAAS